MSKRQDDGGTASKVNRYEVDMVVKTVRYLLLQGYDPDQVIECPCSDPIRLLQHHPPSGLIDVGTVVKLNVLSFMRRPGSFCRKLRFVDAVMRL